MLHDSLLLSKLPDHAPVLQGYIPQPHQGLLRHRSSTGRFHLRCCKALQFCPLFCPHPLHVLPIDFAQPRHVLCHGTLLLSLVTKCLTHHFHLRNAAATLASSLSNLDALPCVLLSICLPCVEVFRIAPKLTDFRCSTAE